VRGGAVPGFFYFFWEWEEGVAGTNSPAESAVILADGPSGEWKGDPCLFKDPGDKGIAVGARPNAVAKTVGILLGIGNNGGEVAGFVAGPFVDENARTAADVGAGVHEVLVDMTPTRSTGIGGLPYFPAVP